MTPCSRSRLTLEIVRAIVVVVFAVGMLAAMLLALLMALRAGRYRRKNEHAKRAIERIRQRDPSEFR